MALVPRAIPILAWIYIFYGLFTPLAGVWYVIWAVLVVCDVGLHGLRLFVAIPRAKRAGVSVPRAATLTMRFGAPWWKALPGRRRGET